MSCRRFVFTFTFLLSTLLFSQNTLAEIAPFNTRTLQEPVFGSSVYLREAGQAHPEILLLVHGSGDDAGQLWNDLIPKLALRYHVVAPDLPGFGFSSKSNQLYSPENYARFLDWLIGLLPPKPVNLVGHSMGGGMSLVYSAYHGQKLKRLVLVDSVGVLHYLAVSQNFVRNLALDTFLFPPVGNPIGRVAGLLLEKATKIPFSPEIILGSEALRRRFLAADPQRIAGLALVQTDYSLLLDQVAVPTWLIWGEEDRVAPLRIAKIMEWRLPQVQLHVLPGVGHVPMKEVQPRFHEALLTALETLPQKRVAVTPPFTGREARCEGKRGALYEGVFDELIIAGCEEAVLRNATVGRLEILDSSVVIEDTLLIAAPDSTALSVTRSKVEMTGVDISAATGILTDQSRLDLAGVRFNTSGKAVSARGNPSALLFSACTRVDEQGRLTPLHLSRTSVKAGEGF